jgi:hypothetical protein
VSEPNGNGGKDRPVTFGWLGKLILTGAILGVFGLGCGALAWARSADRDVAEARTELAVQRARTDSVLRELELIRTDQKAARDENREDHAEIKRAVAALRRP